MAENSKIEWCDHTFNPWIGCTAVSPACDNCYAEALMDRRLGRAEWGAGKPRSRTTASYWKLPIKWNREAEAAGTRPRVFCASLADVFDTEVPGEWLVDLFELIADTPNLDWLLLTKRPHVARRWFNAAGKYWPNVWLGTTAENQSTARARIPDLIEVTHVKYRFLSMEPLLGDVDLNSWLWGIDGGCAACPQDEECECAWYPRARLAEQLDMPGIVGIDWVIVGGESGRNPRPMYPVWARSIQQQCADTGHFDHRFTTPFFMKQMSGSKPEDRKAIPQDLLVRQFPTAHQPQQRESGE